MKQKIVIPLLLVFLSAFSNLPPENTTIVTTSGAFVLTAPEKCINSKCLNTAIHTAQLAGKAVETDMEYVFSESRKLFSELQSTQKAYNAAADTYDEGRKPYEAKLASYENDVKAYDAQMERTVQQKAALDNRKAELDREKTTLTLEWTALKSLKSNLTSKQSQIRGINDKIEQVIEQLTLCKLYGERAIKVSTTKKWGNYRTERDCFGLLKSIKLSITELDLIKSFNKSLY